MKMLRRLPKLLRFIPGTAQDVRAYFLTLQYWLAGSDENIAQHGALPGRPLCRRPAQGAARRRQGAARRCDYPEVGLYHPQASSGRIADDRRRAAAQPRQPTAPSACC